jgi:hypothetical protein
VKNVLIEVAIVESGLSPSFLRTSGTSGRLFGSWFQHFFVRDHIWGVKCRWTGLSGREPAWSRKLKLIFLCEWNGTFPVNI